MTGAARHAGPALRKAVFLDKDGTVVVDVPYNVDPSLMRLTTGAESGLRVLHEAGYLLIIVSNQSGVARGYFTEADIDPVEVRLREMLDEADVPLTAFVYCPHHPDGEVAEYAVRCTCRKPAPGMLVGVADMLRIDLSRSWMVGDILDDIEAGRRAGCRTVLLDVGNETEWVLTPARQPFVVAPNLEFAARLILCADDHSRGASAAMPTGTYR